MNLKKYLDAADAAEARVQSIAAQIDEKLEAKDYEGAKELKPQLDAARAHAKEMHELYIAMRDMDAPTAQTVQPAAQNALGQVQVVKDAADQPFENNRKFLQAVKNAALYPEQADRRLRSRWVQDATGMSEGVPADGGYLLPDQTADGVLENMFSSGQILSRLPIDPVTGNSITYNAIDETSRADGYRRGGIRGYWLGEGGTYTGSKGKFRQFDLKLKKAGALCYATDEQLEDIANLESWIMRNLPDELRFLAEDAVYEGDGVAKPLGIMNSPCLLSVTRTDASKILFADVINMWARRYASISDYVWFINQDCGPQLDQMVIGTEAPPRFVDYGPDGVLRMKGKPVYEIEYASTMGTTGDIMLASLSQYQAISKGGIKSAQSIHVAFVTGEMAYRFTYRIDGQPTWHSAVTPFKGSNTVSPFVCLTSASS